MLFVGSLSPFLSGIHGVAPGATVGILFLFFLKAGAFVFGSGLAIVPFLYGEWWQNSIGSLNVNLLMRSRWP